MKNKNLTDVIKELSKNTNNNNFLAVVRKIEDAEVSPSDKGRSADQRGKFVTVEPCNSPNFDQFNGQEDNYIYNVRLTSKTPGSITPGLIYIPTINSYVVVSWYNDQQKYNKWDDLLKRMS